MAEGNILIIIENICNAQLLVQLDFISTVNQHTMAY